MNACDVIVGRQYELKSYHLDVFYRRHNGQLVTVLRVEQGWQRTECVIEADDGWQGRVYPTELKPKD